MRRSLTERLLLPLASCLLLANLFLQGALPLGALPLELGPDRFVLQPLLFDFLEVLHLGEGLLLEGAVV